MSFIPANQSVILVCSLRFRAEIITLTLQMCAIIISSPQTEIIVIEVLPFKLFLQCENVRGLHSIGV